MQRLGDDGRGLGVGRASLIRAYASGANFGALSEGASDAKQFYVSVSRGRKEVRIYTDEVEALRENVVREREREMAMEITM